MENIFKFETEKELTDFDKLYTNEPVKQIDGCWIYNEGLENWFSLQYCGDCWIVQMMKEKSEPKRIYPKSLEDLMIGIDIVLFENLYKIIKTII